MRTAMVMASLLTRCWRRLAVAGGDGGGLAVGGAPHCLHSTARCYHAPLYEVKVGIPEFLKGVGNGVDTHAAKLEAEVGDLDKLLFTRTLRLKKLGIPVKHRKLILKYTHKYRLGLWRPRFDQQKVSA